MSYAENPEKWHQLDALYASKSDEELLDLQAVYADLTEDAQGILRAELDHRKLSADSRPVPDLENEPVSQPVDPPSEIDLDTYSEYELLQMGGDALCECETTQEAELICFVLDRQKIYAVTRRNTGVTDVRPPQVLVAPDDLGKAQAILDKEIPPELREEFESLPVELDFQNPPCPMCGSLDALLECVDPANHWLCGDCGTQWQDALPE